MKDVNQKYFLLKNGLPEDERMVKAMTEYLQSEEEEIIRINRPNYCLGIGICLGVTIGMMIAEVYRIYFK